MERDPIHILVPLDVAMAGVFGELTHPSPESVQRLAEEGFYIEAERRLVPSAATT